MTFNLCLTGNININKDCKGLRQTVEGKQRLGGGGGGIWGVGDGGGQVEV